MIYRLHKAQECFLVVGHRGGPHDPVVLGVVLSNIERQSVAVLMLQVVFDFAFHHFAAEDISPPKLVPHHIVFLTPGVLSVESQAVVVVLTGILLPLACHLPCAAQILVGHLMESFHACHLCIAGNAHDGFYCQVGIVCPVAGKVVGAELVGRVLSVVGEIIGPCGDNVPVLVDIPRVSVNLTKLGSQRKHVACLLEWHVTTIDLTVGNRVGAQVVGGEWLGPAS